MSHFAQINSDNIVVRVIVAQQEFIDSGAVGDPATWIETCPNTRGGVYFEDVEVTLPDGQKRMVKRPAADQSKALRKNFAGVGFAYDPMRDAFVPPKPDFVFDEAACAWRPRTSTTN